MATVVPFYFDWGFWAVIIAAFALLLSQLPPIHLLVKKAALDLEIYSKASITHKVGNPNLQMQLIVRNVGGRKVRAKAIYVSVERERVRVAELPAQNYLQDPNGQNTVLFTPFSLEPEAEWVHIVNFLNFFGRGDERRYRGLERDLRLYILNKRQQIEGESTALIVADDEHVAPLQAFFGQHFIWTAGNYTLDIAITTDSGNADIQKRYRFTLFESQEQDLRAITDEYKNGAGIYWNSQTPTSVLVDLAEP